MPDTTANVDRDPHFIGWLPMPRTFARYLFPVAAGLVVAVAVAAVFVARGQRSPGDGEWDDQSTTFDGIVYAEPYAMIRVASPPDGAPQTILLVEEGKFGAKDRVRPFDGRPVRVRGTLLHRDGRSMLEIAGSDARLQSIEMPAEQMVVLRRSPPVPLGPVVVRGEIIDSKCYLGAMKPGDGKTHRGCAVLCLRGGVPPMLVSGGDYYLLVGPDGGPVGDDVFEFVGEPVQVDAQLERWDDLRVLHVAARGLGRVN